MAEKPKTRLRNLRITRVDLVDHGASLDAGTGEGAYVMLFKRADESELIDIGKPYPNEHAARMHDPGAYVRFRRKELTPGITAIIGFKEAGGSEVQSMRFDREKFTATEAKVWLKEHDMKPTGFEAATGKASKNDSHKSAGRYKDMLDMEMVVKRLAEIEGTEDIVAFVEELHAKVNPAPAPKPEDVFKALAPEIRTRIEKAETAAAEAQTLAKQLLGEKELGEMVTVCKGWSNISVDLATMPAHLLAVKRIDPVAYEAVSKQFDKANAASKLTKEFGRPGEEGSGDGTAVGEVMQLAEALVAKDAKITHDEAVDLVFRDRPDLYKRYRAESAVRA